VVTEKGISAMKSLPQVRVLAKEAAEGAAEGVERSQDRLR